MPVAEQPLRLATRLARRPSGTPEFISSEFEMRPDLTINVLAGRTPAEDPTGSSPAATHQVTAGDPSTRAIADT